MKFQIKANDFFKEWRSGDVRILNDIHAKVFYRYEVQKFDGTRWTKIRSFRTLAEAKEAAAWVLDDMNSDRERMG